MEVHPVSSRWPREEKSEITQEIDTLGHGRVGPKDQGVLQVIQGPEAGLVIEIPLKGATVLGRGSGADIRFDDPGLSRQHARFYRMDGAFCVEDLRSTNGVFVEGIQISGPPARLAHGDRITLGAKLVLAFELQDDLSREATEKLYEKAVRDPLTQLYNRRYMDERLTQELAYSVRHQSPLSVLMLDIDHFKAVNDTYGHPAGDAVLREVAALLLKMVRTEDLVARYGGEEMCIVARGVPPVGALALAERLRRGIERMSVMHENHQLQVSASIGAATFERMGEGDVVALADQALYEAKNSGRNRSVHHSLQFD